MSGYLPVAVVTGANSGIGRATAIHLASHGYRVLGTARSRERAAKAIAMAEEAGVTIEWIEMDIADDASVTSGFREIFSLTDRVDVLVNNAGVGGNAVVEECPPEMFLDVMNINLCGAVRCIREVAPQMRNRRSGCITQSLRDRFFSARRFQGGSIDHSL